MKLLITCLQTAAVVILALLAASVLSVFSFKMYQYFAPRYAAVDAVVFKESVQYNDGMVRDLENLKMEYNRADSTGKSALRPIILHRFAAYDETRLPHNLRVFYNTILNGDN